MAVVNRNKILDENPVGPHWVALVNPTTGAVGVPTVDYVNQISSYHFEHFWQIDTLYSKKVYDGDPLLQLPRNKYVEKRNFSYGKSWTYNSSGKLTRMEWGCLGGVGSPLAAPVADPGNLSLTRALLNTSPLKANLLVSLGERRQLANLVAGTARRIAAGVRSLRRGNINEAMTTLGKPPRGNLEHAGNDIYDALTGRGLAEAWLEAQYGWRPLLNDVYALVDLVGGEVKPLSFQAIGTARYVNHTTSTGFTSGQREKIVVNASRKRSAKTYLRWTISDQLLRDRMALGTNNPALLVWELLPWSFVVDWFLPIGDYFEALAASDGLTLSSAVQSSKDHYTSQFVQTRRVISGTSVTLTDKRSSWDTFSISRANLSSIVPSYPKVKNPLSFTHVANALALLRTAFSVR